MPKGKKPESLWKPNLVPQDWLQEYRVVETDGAYADTRVSAQLPSLDEARAAAENALIIKARRERFEPRKPFNSIEHGGAEAAVDKAKVERVVH